MAMAAIRTPRVASWKTTVIWAAVAVVLALASTVVVWRTLPSSGPVPSVSLNTPILLFCETDPFCLGQEVSHESPIYLDRDVDREDVLKVYPVKFTVDWEGGRRDTGAAEYMYEYCGTSVVTTCVVSDFFVDCTCTWNNFTRYPGFGFDHFSPIDPGQQPKKSLNTPVTPTGKGNVVTFHDVVKTYPFVFTVSRKAPHGWTAAAKDLFEFCGKVTAVCQLNDIANTVDCQCRDQRTRIDFEKLSVLETLPNPHMSLNTPVAAFFESDPDRPRPPTMEDVLIVYPVRFTVVPERTKWATEAAKFIFDSCGMDTRTSCEVTEISVKCSCNGRESPYSFGFDKLVLVPTVSLGMLVTPTGGGGNVTFQDVVEKYPLWFPVDLDALDSGTGTEAAQELRQFCNIVEDFSDPMAAFCQLNKTQATIDCDCECAGYHTSIAFQKLATVPSQPEHPTTTASKSDTSQLPRVSLNSPVVTFVKSDPQRLRSPTREEILEVYPVKFTVSWEEGHQATMAALYVHTSCSTVATTTCEVADTSVQCSCFDFDPGNEYAFDEFSPIDVTTLQPVCFNDPIIPTGPGNTVMLMDVEMQYPLLFTVNTNCGHDQTAAAAELHEFCDGAEALCNTNSRIALVECQCNSRTKNIQFEKLAKPPL
jgi:hypothetical protein